MRDSQGDLANEKIFSERTTLLRSLHLEREEA